MQVAEKIKRRDGEQKCSRALEMMLRGAAMYCDGYATALDSLVGADYILGDEGIRPILEALRTMLNGPCDERDDRGAIDRSVLSLAARNGIDLEA
jgi:hypothetical protein